MNAFSIQGVTIASYSQGYYLSPQYIDLLQEAASDGANWVVLSTDAAINLSTGAISDNLSSGFDQTEAFSDVGQAIAAAEAQGLSVMLKPQIGMYHADGSFGNLVYLPGDPTTIANPAAFFASYKAYILQWAELAQQYNVPILSIGNEMAIATQPQYTSYWIDIIESIRQVYHGELTYAAFLGAPGTTGIDNEVQQIQFWNYLDYAGMDVYPDLTNQTDPTVSQLNADWTSGGWTQYVSQLASQIGKPVLFTETGVNSYAGADADGGSEAYVGQPGIQIDWSSQELWWQSFFDTWAINPPSWLTGIFAVNFDPPANATYYTQSLDINGKPAELVLSAWFGGRDYLSSSQSSFQGSPANDSIYLYGNAVPVSGGPHITQPQTFATLVSVTMNGTIINNQTPTVEFYINGADEGPIALQNVQGGAVGVTTNQTFTFTVSGLVDINNLHFSFNGPLNVGGQNLQTYVVSASVNGVPLTQATYNPSSGPSQQEAIGGSVNQYDGGSLVFDASPWNTALASRSIGTAANPIQVDGDGGVDIVHVLGSLSDYTITGIGSSTVVLAENAGLDQNAILTGITFVEFQNGTILQVGPLDPTEFYQAILQRVPTNAEVIAAMSLEAMMGTAGVIASVVDSLEAQYNVYPIVQIIELATGNMPTAAQLSGWVPFVESAGLLQGQSQTNPLLDQMAEAFVASTMFGNIYNGDIAVDPNASITASIASAIIQAATGIAATQAQIDAWVATGLSIDQVFVDFALGDQYTAYLQNTVQQYLTTVAETALGSGGLGAVSTIKPNDGLTATQVEEAYQAVLQRAPSAGETNAALSIDSTIGNVAALAVIVDSSEAQYNVNPIVQIIELATGSLPTAAQLAGWVPFVESAGLLQGQSQTDPLLDQMAEAFVASTMFGNTYNGGTAVDPNAPITASIVSALIQAATGVAASQAQIDAWVATGFSIDQVFVGFALGDQYTAASQNMVQDYLTATAVNGAGLSTVDGINATGALTLGTIATPLIGNELTVQGGSGSLTVVASGNGDTITELNTSTAGGTIMASGNNDVFNVANGANTITADGTGDTINLGVVSTGTSITAAQTIHASGTGDIITFAAKAADGTAVTWSDASTVDGGNGSTGIGANSTVNFGTNAAGGTETVVVSGDLTGATTSGGTSTGGIAMITLGNVVNGQGDQIVFNNATTELLTGSSAVNVSAAHSLAAALDLAAAAAATSHGGTIAGNTGMIDWFQYSGNTYLVEAINNSASAASHSALAAADEVIEIAGLVSLNGASLASHTLTL